MKPAVTYPRVETVVVDFLTTALSDETVTVGAALPNAWTKAATPHLLVATDGTPVTDHPVSISPTVRLVAWSASPTESHRLVMLAHGLMCAHAGPEFAAFPLTGPLPVVDPDHDDAALCAVTVRVRIRSVAIS